MSSDKAAAGSVLRIERSSIHDGQGLRTVLFLKGCPLNCSWCSTPESKQPLPERGYDPEQCTTCLKCIDSCPEGALRLSEQHSKVLINPAKCKRCFKCLEVCPSGAVKKYGYTLSMQEVIEEISKDEIFYFHSGGGITLSGGEPLAQADFAAEVLKESKMLGIHTAMESSMYGSFEQLDKILPWLDILFADIKHMDSQKHEKWTGEGNSQILDNLRKTDQSRHPLSIIVRIPLIPGFNDSDQNLQETVDFCSELSKLKAIELLPYHRLGIDTYRILGRSCPCRSIEPQNVEQLLERAEFMKRLNSSITINTGSGFTAG